MSRRPGPGPSVQPGADAGDEFGFDETGGRPSRFLGQFVPAPIARRAVDVVVRTDRDVYDRGEPVEITVTFENRLPVPLEVPTPERRLWGWTVDGALEASDERRYTRPSPTSFPFRGGERKRVSFEWNGRFERTCGRTEWVLPDPGEYKIEAFVAVDDGEYRPTDSTTIAFR